MSYSRAKVKKFIIFLKEHPKGCLLLHRVNRTNTTNDGGGSADSGSSYILLLQEAKHVIKRVSTKKHKTLFLRFLLRVPRSSLHTPFCIHVTNVDNIIKW